MIPGLLGAVALLAGPAVLPVVAAVGADAVAALLLLPAGGLLAAAAAVLSVAFGGSLPAWYIAVAVGADATAAAVLLRGGARRVSRPGVLPVLAVALAACPPLLALRSPRFGWDARSIWWLHAKLLTSPHAYAAALRNPAYGFSHMTYPPLLPASVSLAWLAYGQDSYRLAQVLVTLMNATAMALLGWTVVQVASRRAAARTSLVVGGLVVLGGFGLAGVAASDGYADLFAAATGAAAVVAGLVLPRGPRPLAVAVACAWCAGNTKNEGLLNAVLTLLLIGLRYLRGRAWLLLPVFLLPLGAWQAAVAISGGAVTEISAAAGVRQDVGYRLHMTVPALVGHVWVLAAAAVVSAALVHPAARQRGHLGSPLWRWSAVGFSLAVLLAVYVTGPLEIRYWLATSVSRTTVYPRLLLLSEVAVCAVLTWENVMTVQARNGRGPT